MNVYASSVERRQRAPIMSSFHAAFSIGGMAGALLAGALAPKGVVAELGTAATLCCFIVLAAAIFTHAGEVAPTIRRSPIVPDRALWPLGLLAMFSLMIEGAVADWSGTLITQSGADLRSTTFGYGAFSCAMACGRLLGDWLVGHIGAPTVVRCGGALAATGLALVARVPTPTAGIVGFGLVGLGLSNVVPIVFSAAGSISASVAAAVVTAGYAGLLLGPVVIGSLATVASLNWGMGVLAVASAAVSALAMRSSLVFRT